MLVVGSGDWWAGKKGGDGDDQGEWLWRGVLRVDLRCLRPTMWLDLGHW